MKCEICYLTDVSMSPCLVCLPSQFEKGQVRIATLEAKVKVLSKRLKWYRKAIGAFDSWIAKEIFKDERYEFKYAKQHEVRDAAYYKDYGK